jgi:cephalosporin hydroxylase
LLPTSIRITPHGDGRLSAFKKAVIAVGQVLFWLGDLVVVPAFHFMWYYSPGTWYRNTFLGYNIQQCPPDLQLYQELIYRLRPAFVVQTGVSGDGSILYFASMLDLIGAPPSTIVIGIAIKLTDAARTLSHPCIRLFEGNAVDPELVRHIKQCVPAGGGLVVLDSDHTKSDVLAELHAYNELVADDSYLAVEDTNINGHPVFPLFGARPLRGRRRVSQKQLELRSRRRVVATKQVLVSPARVAAAHPCGTRLMPLIRATS